MRCLVGLVRADCARSTRALVPVPVIAKLTECVVLQRPELTIIGAAWGTAEVAWAHGRCNVAAGEVSLSLNRRICSTARFAVSSNAETAVLKSAVLFDRTVRNVRS
jgi:hypothetical protein